jgi:hypothetical protein
MDARSALQAHCFAGALLGSNAYCGRNGHILVSNKENLASFGREVRKK